VEIAFGVFGAKGEVTERKCDIPSVSGMVGPIKVIRCALAGFLIKIWFRYLSAVGTS
jgi:hypothetical protein